MGFFLTEVIGVCVIVSGFYIIKKINFQKNIITTEIYMKFFYKRVYDIISLVMVLFNAKYVKNNVIYIIFENNFVKIFFFFFITKI